ncbi:MAG: GFA family protein [Pseudomonadota bacterium]
MSSTHHGSCLCKGIRFTIAGDLAPIQVCHCSQCRQAQGGPVGTNIPVPTANLSFQSGEDLLQLYESSPGKIRAFCRTCGSPVFSRRAAVRGVVRIRAGLLSEPVSAHLAFNAYVGDKASWWPLHDGLPQYPAAPPANPSPVRQAGSRPLSA